MKLLDYQKAEIADSLSAMTKSTTMGDGAFDESAWSNTQIGELGNVSVKAAEGRDRNLSPAEAYEMVIAVNKAVSVIARQISKAHLRLFTSSGDEIIGGPLFSLLKRPAPGMGTRAWLEEIVSWFNIAGEWNVWARTYRGENYPRFLLPLNPLALAVSKPQNPAWRWEIAKWLYTFRDGEQREISATEVLGHAMFNPNHSTVRGLPPPITGQIEAGIAWAVGKYNKNFFENGAIPSHIVNLGEGVGRTQRKDIEAQWRAEYSPARNNAFKALFTSGSDVTVTKLAESAREGSFGDLRKQVMADIFMLYGVPPIEAGLSDATKYDSAAEERELFIESTLEPQMHGISGVLQEQLVDRFFSFSEYQTKGKQKLTKSMDRAFEQARSERDGRILILLDPDSLPIMARVTAAKVAQAKEFREVTMTSPKRTCEFYNLDIDDDRPERDEIYMLNNYVCVTDPKINERMQPAKTQQTGEPAKANGRPEVKTKSIEDRGEIKAFEKATRKLRKLTLEHLDHDELWPLADADSLVGEDYKRQVRVIRHQLKAAIDCEDPKAAAKEYFNRLDASALLESN